MSAAVQEALGVRTTRLSVLVSGAEAEAITQRAQAAGLSVSGFLREQALGLGAAPAEEAALRQVDELIDRMTRDLDGAIKQVKATLARLDRK